MDGVAVRAAIAVSFGCPFSGPVAAETVLDVARRCADAGAADLDIADTIGIADPRTVTERFGLLRAALPAVRLAAHFHDTRGMGLANVWAALGAGIDRFDASIAGLGGCPFAPRATKTTKAAAGPQPVMRIGSLSRNLRVRDMAPFIFHLKIIRNPRRGRRPSTSREVFFRSIRVLRAPLPAHSSRRR